MNINYIIKIEELLNSKNFPSTNKNSSGVTAKYDPQILDMINTQIKKPQTINSPVSIYDKVIDYIKKMNDPRFIKRIEGDIIVKEAPFYQYAHIDKSTWSDMKWKNIKIKKKTIFKLILALNLNQEQAEDLLSMIGETFDFSDKQEIIILAIINLPKTLSLNVEDIKDILYYYQEMYDNANKTSFDSIYDMAEDIAQRREKLKNKKN